MASTEEFAEKTAVDLESKMLDLQHKHDAEMADMAHADNQKRAKMRHNHRKMMLGMEASYSEQFPHRPYAKYSSMCYSENQVEKHAERDALLKLGELNDVEIFATGVHKGKKVDEAVIDQVIANYKSFGKEIDPPMVLGHDENQKILQNSGMPALGWTTSVSKHTKPNGEVTLVASFSDVPDIVKEVIQKKRYKRISAELYADYKGNGVTLRRVSLLGAEIPEVKTLADVVALDEMSPDDLILTEHVGGTTMADPVVTAPAAKSAAELAAEQMAKDNADLKLRVQKLEEDNKALDAAHKATAQELAKKEVESRRSAIGAFCEDLKRAGKVLPKWEEQGLRKFMETLEDSKVQKFAEGKEELSPLSFMKKLLSDMPDVVKLSELASTDAGKEALLKNTDVASKDKNARLDKAAQAHIAEQAKNGKVVEYTEAVRAVAKADPGLVDA